MGSEVSRAGHPVVVHPAVTERFLFAIPRPLLPIVALFGAGPGTAWVLLDDAHLDVRFGLWHLRTPADNLAGAELAGPFRTVKSVGVRLSMVDRGITFGTNGDRGVCIRFHRPVPAADPFGLLRHPATTVTVADPEGLVAAVTRRTGDRGGT